MRPGVGKKKKNQRGLRLKSGQLCGCHGCSYQEAESYGHLALALRTSIISTAPLNSNDSVEESLSFFPSHPVIAVAAAAAIQLKAT